MYIGGVLSCLCLVRCSRYHVHCNMKTIQSLLNLVQLRGCAKHMTHDMLQLKYEAR